jgi:hypothetical protein
VTTPYYHPGQIEMLVHLRLDGIPAIPTRYSVNDIIPAYAKVRFLLDAGEPRWQEIELTGVAPLKSGAPSKRRMYDNYMAAVIAGRSLPDPVQAILDAATDHLKGILR